MLAHVRARIAARVDARHVQRQDRSTCRSCGRASRWRASRRPSRRTSTRARRAPRPPPTLQAPTIEERVLGFAREDDVPSGRGVRAYLHFLRTGDEGALLGVVEHNAWDVFAMVALVGLYGERSETASLLAVRPRRRRAHALPRQAERIARSKLSTRRATRGAGAEALRARSRRSHGTRGERRSRARAIFEAVLGRSRRARRASSSRKLYEHHKKDYGGRSISSRWASPRPRRRRDDASASSASSQTAPSRALRKTLIRASHETNIQRYSPAEIEPKWQRCWEENQTFRAERHAGRAKLYVLDMFPYPSGAGLHVGHPEGYTATDIVARYKRMRGFDVLHPMGWDAFGLPAEQHAIKTGTHPRDTTREEHRQLQAPDQDARVLLRLVARDRHDRSRLRASGRSGSSSSSSRRGWPTVARSGELVPRAGHGAGQRGGRRRQERARAAIPVERLPLRQWMLRITAYADRLVAGPGRPRLARSTKAMQRDWIGRSEGAEIDFAVGGRTTATPRRVFTTRPDTLSGAPTWSSRRSTRWSTRSTRRSSARGATPTSRRRAQQERPRAHRPRQGQDRAFHRRLRHQPGQRRAASRSGSPTTSSATTARAPSWPCPRTTSATTRSRGRTGCRSSQVDRAGRRRAPIDVQARPFTDDGVAVDARRASTRLPTARRAPRRAIDDGVAREARARATRASPTSCATGSSRASATGASRSPSTSRSTSRRRPAQARRERHDPLRPAHRRRRAELPLALPDLEDFQPPATIPPARSRAAVDWRFFQKDGQLVRARDQHDAAVGRLVLVLPALPRPEERRREPFSPEAYDALDAASTSTSAAPSTPCCTCSTRASGTRCSSTSAS